MLTGINDLTAINKIRCLVIVGIDPGKKGAFVAIDKEGEFIQVWDMPLANRKIEPENVRAIYREIRLIDPQPFFIVEKPHTRPTDGKKGIATTHWEAGLLMMLVAWGWGYMLIQPNIWTKQMHLGLPTDLKAKAKSKLAFTRMYPKLAEGDNFIQGRSVLDGRIDALLIAEFGRRFRNGTQLAD